MEKQDNYEGKMTLVRRVSDLFNNADGNNEGSTLMLRHTSMQKLRHCCQNLNLFPILLYSFGNPTAYPMPMSKIHVCLGLLLARIIERIYRVYSSIRCTIIRGLRLESSCRLGVNGKTDKTTKSWINDKSSLIERKTEVKIPTRDNSRKFKKFAIQKPKRTSLFLKIAIYVAPLILAFQLVGIFVLMIFGKYTPGFVFLFAALIFLGCISMKVLNHDVTAVHTFKREKRKVD